jgi:acyl-coenzyme A thioesterase PaaI-like protein
MTGLFTAAGHRLLQPQRGAAGPHDPQLVAGGAIAAAAVTLSEPSHPAGWRLARLTADFLRPAPMVPLRFQQRTVRQGRRVVVEEVLVGQVSAGEGDHQVATISLLWLVR